MRVGAHHLVGKHDFTTFRASECQARSPVRTVDAIEITANRNEVSVSVRAVRSFIARCAASWARWNGWVQAPGHASGSGSRLRPGTAPPVGLWHRRTVFTWQMYAMNRIHLPAERHW